MRVPALLRSIVAPLLIAVAGIVAAPLAAIPARAVDPVPAPALASLEPSAGRLFPAFDAAVASYLVKTATTVETLDLGVTANDAGASVSCEVGASSVDCAAVATAVGDTVITVTVTAADAATAETTVTVRRAAPDASGRSDLGTLVAATGALDPVFDPNITSYALDAGTARTTGFAYTLPAGADASCAVDGATADCATVLLQTGSAPVATTITILVTAEDQVGTTTYTINATRTPLDEAHLDAIGLSAGAFSPAFDPTLATAQLVVTTAPTIDLDPQLTDNEATLECLDGSEAVASCSGIALELATAPAVSAVRIIRVTAEDGTTTRDYRVEIRRDEAPSTDASLTALALSDAVLSPAFDPATTTYSATTIAEAVDVSATPAPGAAAACALAGSPVACTGIELTLGANELTLEVTAADGVTSATYTVSLTRRAPSTDASLELLSISDTTLSPAFAAATTAYTGETGAETVDVDATPAEGASASCRIDGEPVACEGIELEIGVTTLVVRVTAEDATTTRDYTVALTRLSNDATLSALAVTGSALTPAFDPAVLAYAATVATPTATITATAADGATIACSVAGAPADCAAVTLELGANTVSLVVTAADTVTTAATVLTITRLRTDATLVSLSLDGLSLSPAFSAARLGYTADATDVETTSIRATAVDGATLLCATDEIVGSCSRIALAVGTTVLSVIVTAEDGTTTATYHVEVERPAAETTGGTTDESGTSTGGPILLDPEPVALTPETPVERAVEEPVPSSDALSLDPVIIGILIAIAGLLGGIGIAAIALSRAAGGRPGRRSSITDLEYGLGD